MPQWRNKPFLCPRWEEGPLEKFTSNLVFDEPHPESDISLRQLIMFIPSSTHPSYPLFHCVNRGRKEGSTLIFSFLPSNKSEARMYVSGIIAYLRATAPPWF